MSQSTILFCQCTHEESIPHEVKQSVFSALCSSRHPYQTVNDLCGLAARKDDIFNSLNQDDSLHIVACSHRAVKWLFHLAGSELPENAAVLNMREMDANSILQSLGIEKGSCACSPATVDTNTRTQDPWIPWFPVIDYGRCTNCKQCMNFCLFRVFEIDANECIAVQNPENCKTSCPACARVCPENAIIFPKHASAQINGCGIQDEATKAEHNLENLLKGDLQDILRKRNTGAGGNFPTMEDIALANEERKKCGCESPTPVQIGLMPQTIAKAGSSQQPTEQQNPPKPACNCECGPQTAGQCDNNPQNNCACDCDCSEESGCDCDCDCQPSNTENTKGDNRCCG
jgi:NAD-dependent dihydropyrimidine dehydrogenase PreA subunit